MKKYKYVISVLFCLLWTGASPSNGEEPESFIPGKVYSSIACLKAPDTHYNLYLPSSYDPAKKWPLLFIFSPMGNADFYQNQETAEKIGWILVGSVECRNGPMEPIIKHQDALMEEVKARFSVHPHRLYAAGISGGARMAFRMLYVHEMDGIIPVAGGEWGGLRRPVPWAIIYGISGKTDFNNEEMRQLSLDLPGTYVKEFVFEVFEGGHGRAPTELMTKAMIYLDNQFIHKPDRLPDGDKVRVTEKNVR